MECGGESVSNDVSPPFFRRDAVGGGVGESAISKMGILLFHALKTGAEVGCEF